MARASHYLIEVLIACFILLRHKNAARVSTPPNLLTRQDRWVHPSLNHLYYPSLNPISLHLVTHFSYDCLSSHAPVLLLYPLLISTPSIPYILRPDYFSTLSLMHSGLSIYLLELCLCLRFLGAADNSGVLPFSPHLPPHGQSTAITFGHAASDTHVKLIGY